MKNAVNSMEKLSGSLCASVLGMLICLFLLGCSQTRLSTGPASNTVETFNGLITESSVDSFLTKIGSRHIDKLIVDSPGGETIAAMRMGRWMFDNNVSIQIEESCFSSCANYLFTAGSKKIVLAPGIVAWHGGMEQKNFRERAQLFQGIEGRIARGEEVSARDTALLMDPKIFAGYKYVQRARPIQRDYYAMLKVSEYLTRAGQEPRSFRKLWTLGEEELKAFGVCDVVFPPDYASPEYMKRVNERFSFTIITLKMDAQVSTMLDEEKAKADYRINPCK